MKLRKRGKLNKAFMMIEPTEMGYFYENNFYIGFQPKELNKEKINFQLRNKIKTTKAFKRWLRVNPYNAPKGTEFILTNLYIKNSIIGKIL